MKINEGKEATFLTYIEWLCSAGYGEWILFLGRLLGIRVMGHFNFCSKNRLANSPSGKKDQTLFLCVWCCNFWISPRLELYIICVLDIIHHPWIFIFLSHSTSPRTDWNEREADQRHVWEHRGVLPWGKWGQALKKQLCLTSELIDVIRSLICVLQLYLSPGNDPFFQFSTESCFLDILRLNCSNPANVELCFQTPASMGTPYFFWNGMKCLEVFVTLILSSEGSTWNVRVRFGASGLKIFGHYD